MSTAAAPAALLRLPLSQIAAGPNARGDLVDIDELAASLRVIGQQIPVIVEQLDVDSYRLIDGHRRRAAALQAGLTHLDAVVRQSPSAVERTVQQLSIQGQTRAFDPLSEAKALHRLMFEHKMTREQIAHMIGRPPAWVRDRISLVHLEPDEWAAVQAGRMSVAEALLRLKSRREKRDGRPAPAPRPAAPPSTQPPTPTTHVEPVPGELLAALDKARQALVNADDRCRYHGSDFGKTGIQYGLPRCESCRQPYRVAAALAAIDRALNDAGPHERAVLHPTREGTAA